jgi:diaminohydroxyphosphoribosylaminopyrimidine deaminase / 5-amino-6-(5-phosphoribosylamino)uracil reductase
METIAATIEANEMAWSEKDRRMMRRALELAARGVARVSPGPLVGCVIARDGKTVGEGFYLYERVHHAETIALREAGERARGATAYVSLEPHAHHGRTPPCTDALIEAGVSRVVAPHEDPNPLVSGKGFAQLREAGIQVEVGLMRSEAERLNEKYIHFMRTRRPFVHLKLATSLDGRIATRTGDSRWITNEKSRRRAHELRHEYDAILVGAGTVCADDPQLTDRSGRARRCPLARIVLDSRLDFPIDSQLARTACSSPVIIFSAETDSAKVHVLQSKEIEVIHDPRGGRDLNFVLEELGRREITSVFVEGGAQVAGAFLDTRLINKITFFLAPIIIGGAQSKTAVGGEGIARIAEAVRLSDFTINAHDDDIEITGYATADENQTQRTNVL